jgi:mono/diheme cytochrome c family protein
MSLPISTRLDEARGVMRWLEWRSVVVGLLAAGVLGAIGGLCFVESGAFDVSASIPHGPIIGWSVHTTMIRSVQRHGTAEPPKGAFAGAQVEEGFQEYRAHCTVCHGGPGVNRAKWVEGINPPPPYLIDAAHRWTPAELHFIIGNGVKMTAMPSWKLSLSDQQIWNMVAFLERLPAISPTQYRAMELRNSRSGHR